MSSKEEKKEKKKAAELEKEIESLRQQIKQLEEEKQGLFEQLQRVSADYANFQKRAPRQIADSVAYEKKAFLRSLLPSLDNFEHAFAGSDARSEEALRKIIDGIHMVYDHMIDALRAHGVQKMDSLGKPFDPEHHEAMMQRTDKDKDNNIVLEVFQPGYLLNGQVLRPARVVVNKLPEQQEDQPPAAPQEPDKEKSRNIDIQFEEKPSSDPDNSKLDMEC